MTVACAPPLQAAMGCPVRLSGGTMDRGSISVSFMNSGKTPIRELNLDCAPLEGKKTGRAECHSEAGIFYPGTPYTLRFAYASKSSRSVEVSAQSARLQDGTLWTATQDQPCRPLRIVQK